MFASKCPLSVNLDRICRRPSSPKTKTKRQKKQKTKTKLKTKNLSYTGVDAINPTDMET